MPCTVKEGLRQLQIIGERAHLQRRRLKLSQRQVARMLGWGANRVGQVELAQTDLKTGEQYELAAALKCTVDYLYGITEDPQEASRRTTWFAHSPADQRVSPLPVPAEHTLCQAA